MQLADFLDFESIRVGLSSGNKRKLLQMLGQMAGELLLAGPRVAPGQALATGFRFEHPDLEGALAGILGARANRPRRLGYPRSEGASLP